ncbi:hypothetical protein [Rhodopirellula sallentina]|nr:hypothetical protein [Rhodopirellula sallentina]
MNDDLLYTDFGHGDREYEVTPDRFDESEESVMPFAKRLEKTISSHYAIFTLSDYPGWTRLMSTAGMPVPPDLSQLSDDDVREWGKRAITARYWIDDDSMSPNEICENLKWYHNIMDQVIARLGANDSALHEYSAKLAAVDWVEPDDVITEAIYEHGVPWLLSFVRKVVDVASDSPTSTP